MLIRPLVEVVKVELADLNVEYSLDVVNVLAAIESQRPTELRDDYVFGVDRAIP